MNTCCTGTTNTKKKLQSLCSLCSVKKESIKAMVCWKTISESIILMTIRPLHWAVNKFLWKLSYRFSFCFCSNFRFWLNLVFVFEIQLFCHFNNFGQLFVYFASSNGISTNKTSELMENVYSFNLHKKVVLKYTHGHVHNTKWWKISIHLSEAKLVASALFNPKLKPWWYPPEKEMMNSPGYWTTYRAKFINL